MLRARERAIFGSPCCGRWACLWARRKDTGCWPGWRRCWAQLHLLALFQGGKGIATSAGVYVALAPLAVLVALAVWLWPWD